MDRTRLTFAPDITLDARQAVWLAETRVLAVADLHLGYAWAHRHDGNLLPLSARDDTAERLLALVEDYIPHELVLLGDIVHRAVSLPALKDELCALFSQLSERVALRLIAGNHDARLAGLLRECGVEAELVRERRAGSHLLLHGDGTDDATATSQLEAAHERSGRVFIGHEHPAISVSDGVATRAKCPCFLVAPALVVLPAFSRWSAGSDVRGRERISSFTRQAKPERAVAIAAGKLMPLPF